MNPNSFARRLTAAPVANSLLVALLVAVPTAGQDPVAERVEPVRAGGVEFRFATLDQAREVLKQNDSFIQSLSPFDRQARMRTRTDPGTAAFVEFVANEAIEWNASEREAMVKAIELLGERLESLHLGNLHLALDNPILLVHTTGREESGAAYTRGSSIILPRGKTGTPHQPPLRLIAHELFHVLSRAIPALRDNLYAIIGFQPTGEILLPGSLSPRRITNPDATHIAHALEVQLTEGRTSFVTPVLLAKSKFDPEQPSLFSYLDFKLMEVEQAENGDWIPHVVRGEAVLHDPSLPDFHRQIGRNTGYIIHPDEVLADNFVIVVSGETVKDQWIVERMRELLSSVEKKPDPGR